MDRWKMVRVDGVLELSIPATMSISKSHAMESPTGLWEGEGINVMVDATMYADDLDSASAAPGATIVTESIDARPTRVVTHEEGDGTRVVAAHVPASPFGVTIVVRADSTVPPDIPLRIIRSLAFL